MGKFSCGKREATWITAEGKRKFCRECKTNTCTPRKWRKVKTATVVKNTVIDGERLGDQPVIVPGVKIDLVEDQVVAEWRKEKEESEKSEWTELSKGTELENVAMETAHNVVKNFEPMMKMMTATADIMDTASRPHFGLTLPGHKREREHYALLGVLHAASGRKLWRFWPPTWKPKMSANVVFISNRDDMVWIPPGWDHESITLEGQAH